MEHFVAENGADGGLRLRALLFGFEAPDQRQPPKSSIGLAILPAHRIGDRFGVRERQPDVVITSRREAVKPLLDNANDREWHAVQLNRASDNRGRSAKCALPIAVVQDCDRRG